VNPLSLGKQFCGIVLSHKKMIYHCRNSRS
jgi:hypothetical protein